MPTFGSLFAGIGGMDLGLERAGWECRWQVEWDEWCRRVLAKHWPDVRRYGDIRGLSGYELEPVDLVAGGFPCQPVSHVGRRKAQDDERWLWPEFFRILRLLRPRVVLVENVPGLLDPVRVEDDEGATVGWFPAPIEEVLGDLAEIGYDTEWDCIPAAAAGAPHIRDRVFIAAYREGIPSRPHAYCVGPHRAQIHEHRETELRDEQECQSRSVGADVSDSGCEGLPLGFQGALGTSPGHSEPQRFHRIGGEWWAAEPSVDRVATGVPSRVDRIRGLGNSVCPQVGEIVGRQLMCALI